MRRVLSIFALSFGLAIASPQAQDQKKDQSSPHKTGAASAEATGSEQETGCLTGERGSFKLTSQKQASAFTLTGSADLEKHVGHTVTVTGKRMKMDGREVFRVDSLKHVAASCADGNSPAAAAKSESPAAKGAAESHASHAAKGSAESRTAKGPAESHAAKTPAEAHESHAAKGAAESHESHAAKGSAESRTAKGPAESHTAKASREGLTADDQGGSASDREITQKIRKAVVEHENLSTDAHNVKIITRNGQVTLRGPVRTETERQAIESVAKQVAGVGRVENELTVTPKDSAAKPESK